MPLERAFHLANELFQTPWSTRTVARRDEVAWFVQNIYRRRLALSKLERDLLFAGEHPLRLAFSLLALQIALLVLVAMLPQDWFSPAWIKWGADTLLYCLDHPGDSGCAGLPNRDLLRCRIPAT